MAPPSPTRSARRRARGVRRRALVAGTLLAALVTGCAADPPGPPVDAAPLTAPALPPVFYVDPANPAAREAEQRAAAGETAEAAALRSIGDRPTATWLTADPVRDRVDALVSAATLAGQTPVLVTHNLPERDCGRQGWGGASSPAAYQRWIRDLVAGIGGRPAIVILEPGAVPDTVTGCVADGEQRLALLRDAVEVLAGAGTVRVYLDAGHPGWVDDPEKLATALRQAGLGRANGFALNVANFLRTEENLRYGHRVSDALGGDARFVIDTSRNGSGPHPGQRVADGPTWCNPPGRTLGAEPTAEPGLDRVDALLWIKYPGESDGACRPGEPEVGTWWPEYALRLAGRGD